MNSSTSLGLLKVLPPILQLQNITSSSNNSTNNFVDTAAPLAYILASSLNNQSHFIVHNLTPQRLLQELAATASTFINKKPRPNFFNTANTSGYYDYMGEDVKIFPDGSIMHGNMTYLAEQTYYDIIRRHYLIPKADYVHYYTHDYIGVIAYPVLAVVGAILNTLVLVGLLLCHQSSSARRRRSRHSVTAASAAAAGAVAAPRDRSTRARKSWRFLFSTAFCRLVCCCRFHRSRRRGGGSANNNHSSVRNEVSVTSYSSATMATSAAAVMTATAVATSNGDGGGGGGLGSKSPSFCNGSIAGGGGGGSFQYYYTQAAALSVAAAAATRRKSEYCTGASSSSSNHNTILDIHILNLCVADLLVSIVHCGIEGIWRYYVEWPFRFSGGGAWLCKAIAVIRPIGLFAVSFIIASIALDRLLAVTKPLAYHSVAGNKRRARYMMAVSWLLALVCSLPQALFFRLVTHPKVVPEFRQCRFDDEGTDSDGLSIRNFITKRTHAWLNLTTLYYLPIIIICICYSVITVKQRYAASRGQYLTNQISMRARTEEATTTAEPPTPTTTSQINFHARRASSALSNLFTRPTTAIARRRQNSASEQPKQQGPLFLHTRQRTLSSSVTFTNGFAGGDKNLQEKNKLGTVNGGSGSGGGGGARENLHVEACRAASIATDSPLLRKEKCGSAGGQRPPQQQQPKRSYDWRIAANLHWRRQGRHAFLLSIQLVGAFIVCTAPYTLVYSYYLLASAQEARSFNPHIREILLAFSACNSIINPVLYGRKIIWSVLCGGRGGGGRNNSRFERGAGQRSSRSEVGSIAIDIESCSIANGSIAGAAVPGSPRLFQQRRGPNSAAALPLLRLTRCPRPQQREMVYSTNSSITSDTLSVFSAANPVSPSILLSPLPATVLSENFSVIETTSELNNVEAEDEHQELLFKSAKTERRNFFDRNLSCINEEDHRQSPSRQQSTSVCDSKCELTPLVTSVNFSNNNDSNIKKKMMNTGGGGAATSEIMWKSSLPEIEENFVVVTPHAQSDHHPFQYIDSEQDDDDDAVRSTSVTSATTDTTCQVPLIKGLYEMT